MRWSSLCALSLTAGLALPACSDDAPPGAEGDGDGDTTETAGDGDGDPAEGDGDGDDPTTGDGDGDPTTGDGDGDGDGDPTTGDGDGDNNAVCGNGILEDGELCDDGNTENNDGCLADCTEASCGDGFVNEGVEACDDGVNDGAYGGCEVGCQALAAFCGDGQVNGPEDCDDGNDDLADGCLDSCAIPASCLTLIDYDNTLVDGAYLIKPDGYEGDPFEVWCDMSSDGGGYTFLKVDPGAEFFAANAEDECASWGMQLWIPRSLEHKDAGWAIANDAGIGPDASANYMRILGVYPNQNGATCLNQPMNSDSPNCNWRASDDGPWYVHEVNNITEPNGDNNVTASMYYQWQGNGQIQWHNDIAGNGYSSNRFMCDVGDKLP